MSVTGGIEKVHEYRWDTNTLSWVPWDGSLTTGAITIGTVNQGNAGAQMWKVDASGAPVTTKTPLTPSTPLAVSVGLASAQIIAPNSSRKGLKLTNTSNARISLGHGVTAVLDSGDTLYPGGSFAMDEYDFHLNSIHAIASAALSNLAIQELA
jgi:hypothetical protein